MKSDRGYLYTVLTVMLLLSLFTLAYYFHSKASSQAYSFDIRAEKTANIFDDVQGDLSVLFGLNASVNRSSVIMVVFEDKIPAGYNISSVLEDYKSFLEDQYSDYANANITLDDSQLEPEFILGSYDFLYTYPDWWKHEVRVYNTSNLTDDLIGYDVWGRLSSETLFDSVWIECEHFEGVNCSNTSHENASNGWYARSWSNASLDCGNYNPLDHTTLIPLTTDYTLWVRSGDDNLSDARFMVEVDGVNSTKIFGKHNDDNSTLDFQWLNGGDFSLTASSTAAIAIKVYSINKEFAESCDVMLLTTDSTYSPENYPPLGKLNDTLIITKKSGGNLTLDLNLEFKNVNLSYSASNLLRNETTQFTMNFTSGDALDMKFGRVDAGTSWRESSMNVKINNTAGGEQADLTTRVMFRI
jgi:hypothetical protein